MSVFSRIKQASTVGGSSSNSSDSREKREEEIQAFPDSGSSGSVSHAVLHLPSAICHQGGLAWQPIGILVLALAIIISVRRWEPARW